MKYYGWMLFGVATLAPAAVGCNLRTTVGSARVASTRTVTVTTAASTRVADPGVETIVLPVMVIHGHVPHAASVVSDVSMPEVGDFRPRT